MFQFRVSVVCCLACLVALWLAALGLSETSYAAGLGAECCDDLDARIAELEATSLQKTQRNLNVQLYGQVNRALLIWNDGFASDAYVVDNDTSSTRLGLIGKAGIKPGWFAGYRLEFEFKDASSNEVFDGVGGDEGIEGRDLRIRHAYWFIENDRRGSLSVGHQSPATDDITIINLGAKMSDAALHYNNNFGLRLDMAFGLTTDLTWGHFAHNVDAMRGNFIRYDSPALYGFVLSAAAGENDLWDVALRYHADWDSIRLAAGIGYMDSQETKVDDVRGSASAIHKPTGAFLSAAGGLRNDQSGVVTNGDDAHFYFAQLGVKRKVTPFGDTTIYGEAGVYKDYTVGQLLGADLGRGESYEIWGTITSSEVRRWGFGIEQAFDTSALLLYAQYHYYEADISGTPCGDWCSTSTGDSVEALPVEPWSAVVLGARIQF